MLKFDRPTLVTITAPTCSGKNYLMEALEKDLGFKRIVSTTTRPMRTGEVHGRDYFFISEQESHNLEAAGEFAEIIEFRGVRYGVTHDEMNGKMTGQNPPMVILEPQGLAVYKKICFENNWNVFSIYVSTAEPLRIQRLAERTSVQLQAAAIDRYEDTPKTLTNRGRGYSEIEKIVKSHTDRLLSITTEERSWSNQTSWNAIVPGDDLNKALDYVQQGVKWTNHKNKQPVPYDHYAQP